MYFFFPLLFSCNRWKEQEKANAHVQQARRGMEKEYMERAAAELEIHTKKFLHFYERYNNHLESLDVSATHFFQSAASNHLAT